MKNNIMTITASIAAICLLSACGSSENTANDTTTTTTTTTVTTTAEPETTTETTTTTEATTTTAEPETSAETDTNTEATITETPADENTIVTMADNPDGMYTIGECFRRKAEEATGKKVVEFDYYTDDIPYVAIFEDGSKSVLMMPKEWDSSTVSIDNFEADKDAMEGVECVVTYNP
ncbi:MAG: hypothetical protein IK999_04530 [Ruminococcus sp.]|nr:hypothetical protein [Ruminococcus sp.]